MENGGWSGPHKHPPPRPHHLTLQVADTRHPYTSRGETSDNATTKQAQTLEKPCQNRLGTQQECAGHQERWRRLGQAEGAESKKGCGYACAVRAHMQRPKKPHLQSHPTAQNTTTTPAAHAKTQSHAHNPNKNTMRHLPTDMVESKVCGNRDDKYPLPLSSPQPGAELHRPSPRRKYQTRGVLRYLCAVPERSA